MTETNTTIIDLDEKIEEMEPNYQHGAEEQLAAITSMAEDRDKKVDNAIKHLIASLRSAAAKYRTASGVMNALNVIREVNDKINFRPALSEAQRLAAIMSTNANELAVDIENNAFKDEQFNKQYLDTVLDDCYDSDFVEKNNDAFDIAYQLLLLDMCRSIGGNIQDVVDFYTTAEEEIEKAIKAYEDYCEEHDIKIGD